MSGKSIASRGTATCKGPEVGVNLVRLKNRMIATDQEPFWVRDRLVANEARKASRA